MHLVQSRATQTTRETNSATAKVVASIPTSWPRMAAPPPGGAAALILTLFLPRDPAQLLVDIVA